MKRTRTSKLSKHTRRWAEDRHVTIGVGCTIILIAGLVGLFGYVIPPKGDASASVNSGMRGPR